MVEIPIVSQLKPAICVCMTIFEETFFKIIHHIPFLKEMFSAFNIYSAYISNTLLSRIYCSQVRLWHLIGLACIYITTIFHASMETFLQTSAAPPDIELSILGGVIW